jgi:hypothetical protein
MMTSPQPSPAAAADSATDARQRARAVLLAHVDDVVQDMTGDAAVAAPEIEALRRFAEALRLQG